MVASHMIQSPRSNVLNAPRAGSASDAPPQNDGSEQAIASRILQSGNPQELQAAQAGQMGAGVQAAVASLMSRQPSSSAKPPPRAPLSGLHSVAPWTKPPATAPGGPTDAPAPSAAPSRPESPVERFPSGLRRLPTEGSNWKAFAVPVRSRVINPLSPAPEAAPFGTQVTIRLQFKPIRTMLSLIHI